MRVTAVEPIPVSVPYRRREVSSQVASVVLSVLKTATLSTWLASITSRLPLFTAGSGPDDSPGSRTGSGIERSPSGSMPPKMNSGPVISDVW